MVAFRVITFSMPALCVRTATCTVGVMAITTRLRIMTSGRKTSAL